MADSPSAAQRRLSVLLCGALGLVTATPAQGLQTEPGFVARQFHAELGSPFAMHLAAPGRGDRVIAAKRNALVELDGLGAAAPLHALASSDSIGLLARERGRDVVWCTSLANSVLYEFDLVTQSVARSGPCPNNAFDLDVHDSGAILVTANPSWPSPGASSGVFVVDLVAGQHQEILHLPGPSGPLTFAPNGDLCVVQMPAVVPPAPGSVRILRFAKTLTEGAIRGGRRLVPGDASATLAGLDGAYDLAFDDRGRLHWSDANLGGVRRTLPNSLNADPAPLVPLGPLGTLSLGFVDAGAATFDAYQPPGGAALLVLTSDWQTSCRVFAVTPARAAVLSSPGISAPPGPVAFHVLEAAPSASVALALTLAPARSERQLLNVDGIPLAWGLDPSAPTAWLFASSGLDGRARVDLVHPGGVAVALAFEAVFLTGAGTSLRCGTTPAGSLQLQP